MKHIELAVMACLMLGAASAVAEDVFYDVMLDSLTITSGAFPASGGQRQWWRAPDVLPRVVLDGPGEAYLDLGSRRGSRNIMRSGSWRLARLAVRADAGQEVAGRLFLPRTAGTGMQQVAFRVPAGTETGSSKAFYAAKEKHYKALLARGIPGAAWFRHQARAARQAGGQPESAPAGTARRPRPRRARAGELEDTYAVFTGGRALSENMQLDRLLQTAGEGEATVDVASLTGISVPEMDWAPLIEGLEPEIDPLAALIPADQHALLFPGFGAFMATLDEAKARGTPVLRLLDPRSEDARTHERYERQLCLKSDALSRLLGPRLVSSVALTGSDPYMRTGTDVAVLFEAKDPAVLSALLSGRIAAAAQAQPGAELIEGEVAGVSYSGARSPGRRVCSYLATLGNAVVVTNSLEQLRRLAAVKRGAEASLASLDEFTFMRARYPRGDAEETAFFMLSDAAIRRWCGPRWRIAVSRRTRAAAFMADVHAGRIDAAARGEDPEAVMLMPLPDGGRVRVGDGGVSSDLYGDLEFLTPILELPLSKVTESEAAAYRRWRAGYERNWRQFFDPIAVRLTVEPGKVAADVTVMPLIEGTDYREMIDVIGGARIARGAGDPHADALLHFAMALDADSEPVRQLSGFAVTMMPGLRAQPFAWLGESVAFYFDDSPFWEELPADRDELEDFMEKNFHRLPVAFYAKVRSSLKLTAFLTGLRGMIESSAPGMTVWEVLSEGDQPYVKVSPSAEAKADEPDMPDLAVYYAASGDSLVVTFDEALLRRAIGRRLARRKARDEGLPVSEGVTAWLGASMGLRVTRKMLDVAQVLLDDDYRATMRRRAWGNIPILNEWHRLYPGRDPVEVHEELWQTRLVCPGGGTYAWNEEYQTMASTAYGHPGEPKDGPPWPEAVRDVLAADFGLTFEPQGLRARAVIERTPAGQ